MAKLNKVFLFFHPSQSNEYFIYNTDNDFKSDKNIFRYFDSKTDNKNNGQKNKSKNEEKKIVTNRTNYSSKKMNLRYNTDLNLNDDFDFIIKSNNFKIKSYFEKKKIIHINNLYYDKNNPKKSVKNLEENKNNINPISLMKKFQSRNKLLLKNEIFSSKKKKEKVLFSYDSLSSFNKDIFNLKVNLKDTKNFSLYKTRLLRNKKPAIKPIITEYYSKQEKMHNINKLTKSSKKISKYFYPFKTKYIFKCQDKIPTIKFKGLPDTVKNINKFYMDSVKLESSKYFGSNFAILKNHHFSAKFRNPLNNEILDEKKETKEEKYKEIKEEIVSGQEILNEINLSKMKLTKKRKIFSMKNIYFKFKIWIIRFAEFCKILAIKPFKYLELYYINFNNNDLIFYETLSIKTSELINAIKSKNLVQCNKLIEKYPMTVISKDYFEYTPLHWAVRKKFIEIIPNLILYGANPNSENYLGETPLHLSVKEKDYECTILLLIFMADPFKKNYYGKRPFDSINDYQMNIIYKKIVNLYYINTFKRSKLFVNNIQNKFIDFVKEEFITPDSKDLSNIIEQISKEINKDKKQDKK